MHESVLGCVLVTNMHPISLVNPQIVYVMGSAVVVVVR